jgi:hypothetical protein
VERATGARARQLVEGRVIAERLAANMSELRARLRPDGFHVFHFVGHRATGTTGATALLAMEDRHGRP